MDLQAFLQRLLVSSGPSASGEYSCRCPAHDDRTASLCVREGVNRNGALCLFVKCQAGCPTEDVLRAIGLTKRDLFIENRTRQPMIHAAKQPKNNLLGKPTTVYDYTDETGVVLFQVCRYESDGGKTFRQRVPDANAKGGYRWSIKGVRPVPYRLPEVKQAIADGCPVFLVEGEKDADTMAGLGYTATTNAGGASKDGNTKWGPAHTEALAGADVYILPDNDEAGLNDRRQVAAALLSVCKSVQLLDLTQMCPDLPPKGDITDLCQMLGEEAGRAALQKLMKEAQPIIVEVASSTVERDAAAEHYRQIPGFCVEDGCICQWSEETPRRLATFIALPRAEVTRDDGVNVDKLMVIDGWAKDGSPLPRVRVAAKNFKGMGWVLENWGFRANIMPGNTTMDKLRYAIAEVGARTAKRSTEYTHTGWRKIGGQWAFLFQGGAIGCKNVSVDLGSGLQAYRLDGYGASDFNDYSLNDALETSYMLTTCMKQHIAIPLLGIAYLAPLREALSEAGHTPAFSVYLVGKTGSGKSVAAALTLSHFGGFTAKSLPASFHDTANYIQKKAFLLKDMLIVVDDYHPSTSLQERRRMESTAQNLSRAFGDNAPRNRMNSDTSLRETTPPRCISMITGEDMPSIGPSGMARYYVMNVEKDDVPKGKDAPRRLVSKGYMKSNGYATFEEAQEALSLHVSNHRNSGGFGSWDVFINGKHVTWDEYYAMHRGELSAPAILPPNAMVTLANIEYRIASHIQGAYQNLLDVGHCLNEAKDAGLVPHGEWEAWVRRNTHMSERQAQKLMQAARSVQPGSALERLPISKIQAILSLPESEREPMAEKATSGDMSLRELQEAVKEKQRAEAHAQGLSKQLESAKRDAKAYLTAKQNLERDEQNLRDQLNFRRADIDRLQKELEKANQQSVGLTGISEEAQAEINRLKTELEEVEAYAEQQAEQRQQAQRDMLAMQSQAARGELDTPHGMTAFDLAAAVRIFIGTAGVLPHLGVALMRSSEVDRQQMRQYVDMMAAWVDGARQALDTIVGEA